MGPVTAPASAPPPAPGAPWARWLLGRFGWTVEVVPPPGPRGVLIVYPHTSNWDFVLGVLCRAGSGLRVGFAGKDALFRWPLGGLMRRLGGVPVNRRERTGLVAQLAGHLRGSESAWIAIAPEGTRARTDHWKSGFYQLALAAGVPVGLGFVDYRTRRIGVTTYLTLTGREEEDLARIRAFYAGKRPRHPGQESAIRFRGDGPAA